MTTTTLSSKGRFKNLLMGMLRKNLSLSIYFGAIMFLFFPLQMVLNTANQLTELKNMPADMFSVRELAMGIYTEVSLIAVAGMLTVAAFGIGLIQCSYMHSKRAVDLYHSLPVTRTQLMSAHMLTGFLTIMVPFWVNYLLNLAVVCYRNVRLGSFAQAVSAYTVFWDLVGWPIAVFSILAVVMLVSTQVGSVFENFVFAGELLVAPMAIIGINELLCNAFVVGYLSSVNYKFMLASSPAAFMAGLYTELLGDDPGSIFFVISTVVWLLLGVAIFFAALVLGRSRRSEIAECPGCKGIIGNALTLIAVYIGSIAFGALLYAAFEGGGDEPTFLLCVFVASVLVFFFVEAVLNRGFAGIRKTFPLGAVCCAVVMAATLAVTTGGLGYETRVPDTDRVESVTFAYRGWYGYVTELDAATKKDYSERYNEKTPHYSYQQIYQVVLKAPESIELVKQIHLSYVADMRSGNNQYFPASRIISYKLGSSTMDRQYHAYGDNTRALLNQLNELPEFQEQTNPLLRLKSETVQEINLHDSLGFYQHSVGISHDMGTLLEALRKDALANGTRDFAAGSPVLCYLYINTGGDSASDRDLTENLITDFSVPVFASSTNTIAAIKAMGKGDILQADLSQVTAISFNRYLNYNLDDGFVSGIGYLYDQKDSEYMLTDLSEAGRIATEGVRFQASVDYSRYSYEQPYLTFFKGQLEGITVAIDPDRLPDEVKEKFPELMERYETETVKGTAVELVKEAAAVGVIVSH